jgi:hypothetical protein
MATDEAPGSSDGRPELVSVSITVTGVTPLRAWWFGGRPAVVRPARGAPAAAVAAVVLAALGVAVALPGGPRRRPAEARPPLVPAAERTAIAAALGYPYPLRCLTITTYGGSPAYARANVDRTNGCGRYHGYVNASLHRVDGTWRLVLDEGQLFVPNSRLAPEASGS